MCYEPANPVKTVFAGADFRYRRLKSDRLLDLQGDAMRQTELLLTVEDRRRIGEICSKVERSVQMLNRANVLSALDRKVPEASVMQVLGVCRMMIWRTRAAYRDGGLEVALDAGATGDRGQRTPA